MIPELSLTKRKVALPQEETSQEPFFVPDQAYIITNHGLYIEQYKPNLIELARAVKKEDVIKHFRLLNDNTRTYTFCQGPDGKTAEFIMPTAKEIKVTSIQLYAMVCTYPRIVARLLMRRYRKENHNLVKGLKSIWVIILIVVVLFIIFMLSISIIGASNSDTTAIDGVAESITVDDGGYTVQYTYDDSGRPNPKLESGQSLTAPIPEGSIIHDTSGLPRAIQGNENTARGVLIDDGE